MKNLQCQQQVNITTEPEDAVTIVGQDLNITCDSGNPGLSPNLLIDGSTSNPQVKLLQASGSVAMYAFTSAQRVAITE